MRDRGQGRQTDRQIDNSKGGAGYSSTQEQGQGREQAALRDRQVKRDRGQRDRQTDNSEGEQATAPHRSKARAESRKLSETDR